MTGLTAPHFEATETPLNERETVVRVWMVEGERETVIATITVNPQTGVVYPNDAAEPRSYRTQRIPVATYCGDCFHRVSLHQTGEGPWTGFCGVQGCQCEAPRLSE